MENKSSRQDSIRMIKAQVTFEVLGLPSYIQFQIHNHFLAIHLVIARAVVLVVTEFPDPLTITASFNPLAVTDLVPKLSGLDRNTFTLVRVEVPNFQDHFRFSLEIFSLTSLSYFLFYTWLY